MARQKPYLVSQRSLPRESDIQAKNWKTRSNRQARGGLVKTSKVQRFEEERANLSMSALAIEGTGNGIQAHIFRFQTLRS